MLQTARNKKILEHPWEKKYVENKSLRKRLADIVWKEQPNDENTAQKADRSRLEGDWLYQKSENKRQLN